MRDKKLVRKAQVGMTIVNPSDMLNKAAQSGMSQIIPPQNISGGLGSFLKGGVGKNLIKGAGGVNGLLGMASTIGAAAINKNNELIDPTAQSVQNTMYSIMGTLGPKGQAVASALKFVDAASNKFTLHNEGEDRYGNAVVSKRGAISPTEKFGYTVSNIRDLIKGNVDLKEFGARMVRLTPAGFFLGATAGQKQAVREGETYRNLQRQTQQELEGMRKEAQQRSNELLKDRQTAGWGTMYAKKGGKLPKSCGCNKEKDGLDTDVFYAMPRRLFIKVLQKVNLPEKTDYNDKVKLLIKNSVPKGYNLRKFIESIDKEISDFIKFWENERTKV